MTLVPYLKLRRRTTTPEAFLGATAAAPITYIAWTGKATSVSDRSWRELLAMGEVPGLGGEMRSLFIYPLLLSGKNSTIQRQDDVPYELWFITLFLCLILYTLYANCL